MLKGKTIIELTNVKTGEKEIVEDNNMVTNAINDLFNSFPNLLNPYAIYEGANFYHNGFQRLYEFLLGGLIIFDGQIEENPNNYYPPANVNLVGCGVYDRQNGTTNTMRGSYNQIESEFNEEQKFMKFVYDFKTSEANGTIASVALTSEEGGYTSYGNKNAEYVKSSNGNVSYNSNFCILPFYKNSVNYVIGVSGANICPRTFSYDKNYKKAITDKNYSVILPRCVFDYVFSTNPLSKFQNAGYIGEFLFCIDVDEDAAYYLKVTSSMKNFSIVKRKAYLKNVSVFDMPSCKGDLIKEIELPELSATPNMKTIGKAYSYDVIGRCLYIIYTSNASYCVSTNDSFKIIKIDLNDLENVTLQEIDVKNMAPGYLNCNQDGADGSKPFVSNGFLYVRNTYKMSNSSISYGIYKIEITNPANVILIKNECEDINYNYFYPVYEFNGIIYMQNGCIIKNDEIFKTEHPCFCNINGQYNNYIVPFVKNKKASNLFYAEYGGDFDSVPNSDILDIRLSTNAIGFLNNYLATINNLVEPVTKTADKTMKVTYVIQEVADTATTET